MEIIKKIVDEISMYANFEQLTKQQAFQREEAKNHTSKVEAVTIDMNPEKNNSHGILTRFTKSNWIKKRCFPAAGWSIKTIDWCFWLLCSKSYGIVWNVGGAIITHTIRIMGMEVSIAELLMVFVKTVWTKRNI